MNGPRIGSLFSGYGGLEAGVQSVLGGTVAWHSEIDPGACKILAHRYPDVPNLGDITAVDWSTAEPVDVLTGGFPCQDVSSAGKRAGLHSETRSGLWAQMVRSIDELRPSLVVAENVRGLLSACALSDLEPCPRCLGDESQPHRPVLRALGRVVGDLSDLGYVGRWGGLRAADIGAPHGRFRVFVVAWPADADCELGAGDRDAIAGDGSGPIRPGQEIPRRRRGLASHAHGGAVREQPVTFAGRSRTSIAGHAGADAPADPDRDGLEGLAAVHGPESSSGRGHVDRLGVEAGGVDWGQYGPAVRRWERCLGRPAPEPTQRGKNGQPRLSPAFVEFLMGLPAGHVTDVPGLTRNEQLKALGNGVVPQQAAAALRLLLPNEAGERAA